MPEVLRPGVSQACKRRFARKLRAKLASKRVYLPINKIMVINYILISALVVFSVNGKALLS